MQYDLALQTILLRTLGRSTTLLLTSAVDTVTQAVHCSHRVSYLSAV